MRNQEHYNNLTDQELLRRFKTGGDNIFLGILLERYSMMLFGVCMKYLKEEEAAKDAVQQVYMKAISELKKYNVDYVKSWLYMIARNYCLMQLRNRQFTISTEETREGLKDETDPFTAQQMAADNQLLLSLTNEGLDQLPEPQNKCITLFYLSKKSYQQISDATGFNLMQVKSHIQNGKRNIKLWVEKKLRKHAQ